MNEVHNYSIKKQHAINEMREMNKRATKKHEITQDTNVTHKSNIAGYAFLPFESLRIDSDTIIILALILILVDNNTDKLLLLALVYILS